VITGRGIDRDFEAMRQHAAGSPPAAAVGGIGAPALWVADSELVVLDGDVRVEVSALVSSASAGELTPGQKVPEIPDRQVAEGVAKAAVSRLPT
jgi:hypothetical protein